MSEQASVKSWMRDYVPSPSIIFRLILSHIMTLLPLPYDWLWLFGDAAARIALSMAQLIHHVAGATTPASPAFITFLPCSLHVQRSSIFQKRLCRLAGRHGAASAHGGSLHSLPSLHSPALSSTGTQCSPACPDLQLFPGAFVTRPFIRSYGSYLSQPD